MQVVNDSRILAHCCVARADIFSDSRSNIFGFFLPRHAYAVAPLRSMLIAKLRRILIVYDDTDEFHATVCGSALSEAVGLLAFTPDLKVRVVKTSEVAAGSVEAATQVGGGDIGTLRGIGGVCGWSKGSGGACCGGWVVGRFLGPGDTPGRSHAVPKASTCWLCGARVLCGQREDS